MAYHIDVIDCGAYQLIKAAGRLDNLEEILAYTKEAIDELIDRGCRKALYDQRDVVLGLNNHDAIELADALDSEAYQQKGMRWALISSGENWELNCFFETVFRNRAFGLRVFLNPEDGKDWLLK